jgi:hypothetical protein
LDAFTNILLSPACIKAGFIPDRADDVQHTHVIMLNILNRILEADVAICDLSSKNPNVMYELGIRQAFDKPVALMKDDKTTRIFDTGILSDFEYFSDLRIDNVEEAIEGIASLIKSTYDKKDERSNSLIQYMKIQPATPPPPTVVSPDTNIILEAVSVLGRRISALETPKTTNRESRTKKWMSSNFCWMKFYSTAEKVDDYISLFCHYLPSEPLVTVRDDGRIDVEFNFNEPVALNSDILNKISRESRVQPVRIRVDKKGDD